MNNLTILALAKGYTDETVIGGGAIKGKNCTIQNIEPVAVGNKITFLWTLDDGTEKTESIIVTDGTVSFDDLTPEQKASLKGDKGDTGEKGADGRGIKRSYVNAEDHFIIVYDDDEEEDCGEVTVVPAGSLSDLNDVDLTGATDGNALVYDAETEKWIPGQGGGGADAELSDDLTTAISVGGIASGVTYEAGTPLESLWRDLLEPTLYPTFTAPSASLTYGASTYYAVGATVTAMTATLALNRGSINPAYGTSGKRSGEATNYAVSTSGADTEYSDSSESSGTFNVSALTRSTKGNIVLTGTVSYAQGEQPKDSKGNDYSSPLPAGSVSATKTLQFILPYYYGASNSSTISDFTGLTQSVTAKGQKTFNYTTNNQYMVFVYDSAYGNLKTILDGNGFDVTGGWTKNTVTVGGFSYYVYVANSPTTDTNAPFTFKY